MKIKLAKTENIHFIGIGGIGMSGLAIIMGSMGFKIQGSDISTGKNIDRLKQHKIKVLIGHKKNHVLGSTIIVISSAIKKNNPELLEAKKRKLPIFKRGEMLGHIVSLKKNIVVSGSHGKTTTTSLISSIFNSTSIDPTIINGGVLNSDGNSARLGKSDWCIVEADESDGSFLDLPISYSIVNNIDKEHLDHYGSLENLKNNFKKFIEKTPSFGKSFICLDDDINREVVKQIKIKNILTYGLKLNSNFRINNIKRDKNFSKFDIMISIPGQKNNKIKNLVIPLLGLHNIRNATAAIAVAYSIGISNKMIKNGLKSFKGVQRRFNHIFKYKNSIFIDDYAHHPTEIYSVLEGVKSVYKDEKIYCVFQPHRISRLNTLKSKFVKCFEEADFVLLCPVYKAGENLKLNFVYKNFAKEIIKFSNVKLIMIRNQDELSKFVKHNIYGNNLVIGMGAGSISNWMRMLPKNLNENK